MIIEQVIVAFIASFCFGIVFNIHGKNLLFAAAGGGLSWFTYLYLTSKGLGDNVSFFSSSVIFSIYSEICARKLKTPVTTVLICALIPLVPGAGMYYTMYETITGNIDGAISKALSTFACAGSLALGVLFVSTITKQITQLKTMKQRLLKKD